MCSKEQQYQPATSGLSLSHYELEPRRSHDFVDLKVPQLGSASEEPTVFERFTANASATRVFTDSVVVASIRAKHPDLSLTSTNAATCNLLAFAQSGHASATPFGDPDEMLFSRSFLPPTRRNGRGAFVETVQFACFKFEYQNLAALLYIVDTRDGTQAWPATIMNYILTGKSDKDAKSTDALIEAATRWGVALHDQVLVFDSGRWLPDSELYKSIKKATWKDVILEEKKKKQVIDDVESFFEGKLSYDDFGVPWKRGLIFYGPPGNGKTISIKALMNSLTEKKDPTVELLYVKTLASNSGPEYSIRAIFTKARQMAPCLLIFEDLDSLVTDRVRSYFLNEVDGLESNDGILMIGSTNHLDRLDPGIAKRPSRFDRKYLYSLPTHDERIQYSEYWRKKLELNPKIDFPEDLSPKIADITEEFSFAYMKEAFVATLLRLVAKKKDDEGEEQPENGGGKDDLDENVFWKEIQRQVKNLRDEMGNEGEEVKKSLVTDLPEPRVRNGRLATPVIRRL